MGVAENLIFVRDAMDFCRWMVRYAVRAVPDRFDSLSDNTKVKQWKQLGIIVNLALLAAANGCFYLGATGLIDQGAFIGIQGGLFLIVGLILFMGRRVIPFFIEVGVGYPVKLFNSNWLDVAIILFYIAFFIAEVLVRNPWMVALTSMGLFVANSVRLAGWHTKGIWKKPLLWSLFIAFIWINLGFLLLAVNVFLNLPNIVVIHAFSVGGIGVVILSMMARVTLGHTGRNVQNPPKAVAIALMVLVAGAVVRVIAPLVAESHYVVWVAASQVLWIAAFSIFIATCFPMLVKPRTDGQFG
ncbi:MAG: NnrS family protein [Candidatus Competibacter sp.]